PRRAQPRPRVRPPRRRAGDRGRWPLGGRRHHGQQRGAGRHERRAGRGPVRHPDSSLHQQRLVRQLHRVRSCLLLAGRLRACEDIFTGSEHPRPMPAPGVREAIKLLAVKSAFVELLPQEARGPLALAGR
ncbi:MAG: hypothetical protein ACK56I_28355, partial [bacterium]